MKPEVLISQLEKCGVSFDKGLTAFELSKIERICNINSRNRLTNVKSKSPFGATLYYKEVFL